MITPADTEVPDPEVAREVPQGRWTARLLASLISMVLVLEVLSASLTMVAVGLPRIVAEYHTTQGAWLSAAYMLVGAVISPLVGKLADMHGKRKLLLIMMVLATVGAVVSASAPTYGLMITGRTLQGFLTPAMFLVYSLIRDVFPRNKVALSVSISMSGLGVFTAVSPYVTAWVLDHWGFRGIFWIIAVCLPILVVMISLTTPETSVRVRSRVDLLGAVLFAIGLSGILVGVSFGPTWGWGSTSTVTYFVVGAVVLAVWVVSALRLRDPLIDIRYFRRRPLFLTAVTAGLAYGSTQSFTTVLPILCMTPAALGLGYGLGLDAFGFAPILAAFGIALAVGGFIVGKLVRYIEARMLLGLGLLLIGLGAVLTAVEHENRGLLIVFATLVGLGMGFGVSSVPNLVIAAVPAQVQASVASVIVVVTSTGSAVLPVAVFAVLNSHIATAAQGHVLYSGSGMNLAFVIPAACAFFGMIVSFAVRWRIRG
ncbi:MFS transporter [Nocardia jiangxiensis]|uniref:MFS transporter n=1 Tax=Nocardia jiangxiensis TaxID=282685 RepID=A0ABW6SGM4_9NOCA|nr:MFS transporter [Nocardia jiangxiensis]